MKLNVTRRCKHEERIKIYDVAPDDPKASKRHFARVLLREEQKICRKCAAEAKLKEMLRLKAVAILRGEAAK